MENVTDPKVVYGDKSYAQWSVPSRPEAPDFRLHHGQNRKSNCKRDLKTRTETVFRGTGFAVPSQSDPGSRSAEPAGCHGLDRAKAQPRYVCSGIVAR